MDSLNKTQTARLNNWVANSLGAEEAKSIKIRPLGTKGVMVAFVTVGSKNDEGTALEFGRQIYLVTLGVRGSLIAEVG